MINKKELEIQIKSELVSRGCIEIQKINNDEVIGGYIINEQGSKELKIIGIIAENVSLTINHTLINTAIKVPTVELGIILTPNKMYYMDMKTGMPTDNPKKFISYSQHVTSEEDIKRKIVQLVECARRKSHVNIANYILTPIVVRAYFYKQNNLNHWLDLDINLYNSLIDRIKTELEINDNILEKMEDKDELENIKIGLEMLDPVSVHYAKVVEELLRKNSLKDGTMISTQNMINVASEFINKLNINGKCIELGSGVGALLREQNSKFNLIKGVEINEYMGSISKLLNIVSGKENIKIETSNVMNIDETNEYDLTIIEPPIGERNDSELYKDKYIVARNSRIVNTTDLFIEKAIDITKENGYIVAIINDRTLFTKQSEIIRKLIINNTTIKAIISLPNYIQKPYTVSEMSIVIMKKKTRSLEYSKTLFVNEINKLDEINNISNQFDEFMKNNLSDSSVISYDTLYDSSNWTASYLKIFKELNSMDRYPLKKLCDINKKGIKNIVNQKEKYPYIEVSNIDSDKKVLNNIKEIEYSELPSRAKLLAYPGDIVISTVRPEKGPIAIVPNNHDVYVVSSALAVLSPKDISTELLYFILCSEKVTKELASLASGMSVPMILMKELKEYQLPISSIPNEYEQEAKELYEKMMLKYKQYKTLNQIIDETLENSEKVNKQQYKIDELISYKRPLVIQDNNELKQVKISNLTTESIYIDKKELDVCNEINGRRNLIDNKDILIPRMVDSIERTSIADSNIQGSIANQFIYTYIANEIVLPEYMTMIFRSSRIKEKLEALATEAKHSKMVKREDIQSLNINIPDIKVQKEIVDKILNENKKYSLKEIQHEKYCFENKLV